MSANPGLAKQGTTRNIFRVLGVVLVAGGGLLVVWGMGGFLSGMGADSVDDGAMTSSMVKFAVGGFAAVIGFGFLNAGFGGAAARYAAGETMPVAKDSLEFLTGGKGLGNLGHAQNEPPSGPSEKAGPFCSKCGVRNDTSATFCDACGDRLA